MIVLAGRALFVKGEYMIVDFEWKAGLVFGIDTDEIIMVEEGEDLDESSSSATVITLYLGIIAINMILA
jgi:hypothetical protein